MLLMAFGGPDRLEEVGPFMARLMGREPGQEAVARTQARYSAIGGCSPLPGIAATIADALRAALASRGDDVPVAVGMRYCSPGMSEGLAALADAGAGRVVAVSLSPFDSASSSGAYRTALAEAASAYPDLTIVEASSFRDAAGFLAALRRGCTDALRSLSGEHIGVLFTAHSLPATDPDTGRYSAQLASAAVAVASASGLEAHAHARRRQTWLPGVDAFGSGVSRRPWLLSYQSKGQRGGEWLGPDIADVLRAMSAAGFDGVAVCPIGFATDHMETLYDLDVDAAEVARMLGLAFARGALPNDSHDMVEALVAVVEPLLGSEDSEMKGRA